MSWKKLLESAKESLNDHMRLRNEYLTAENRILRHRINGRVQLTDSERKELAEIGVKLGKKALTEIATVAQPETILAWNRKFANQPTGAPKRPKSVGRPRVDQEIEDWVVRMARENRPWGYDRIQGSLKHLGYTISDQTVGNILKRHGIPPVPERQKTVTWSEFIRIHWDLLTVTSFFNSEVWHWFRQIVSYLLSFIHFSLHQVQSVQMTLRHQIWVLKSLMRGSLDLNLYMQRWTHLFTQQSRARRISVTVLEPMAAEFVFADVPQMRSKEMGTVAVLFDLSTKRIRDGPDESQSALGDFLKDHDRKAA